MGFGGQVRFRHESWSNQRFGHGSNDPFLLGRFRAHADLHFFEDLRVLVEGLYADAWKRDLGPRPIFVNQNDQLNGFVALHGDIGAHTVGAAVGRREPLWARHAEGFEAKAPMRSHDAEIRDAGESTTGARAWLGFHPDAGCIETLLDRAYLFGVRLDRGASRSPHRGRDLRKQRHLLLQCHHLLGQGVDGRTRVAGLPLGMLRTLRGRGGAPNSGSLSLRRPPFVSPRV